MKHKNLLATFASVSLLGMGLICQTVWAQGGNAPAHVPGRILVKFKDGVSDGQARGLLAGRGALSTDVIPQLGVQIVQLPPNANEQAEADAFKGLDEVEFAEVDAILQPQSVTPNDYYYFIGYQWALPKISAPAAWSVTTGSSSVVIAVIDTGVDSTQPDLQGKLVPGWNIYDNSSNTADVASHGTIVAGIVGAATNNSIGVAGVCWNCGVMPVRVTAPDQSATFSNIASGITWAADHGARVANASFACTNSSTVSSAAQYLQSKGGVLTVAAGNYGVVDTNPNDPYIITVGATDQNDALYSGSATGSDIDLVAPGIAESTMPFSMYGAASGTSVAAPFVAGVAGLMLSVNPNLTPTQITSLLQQSTDDLGPAGWDSTYGWGRLNALKAVTAAAGGTTKTNTATAVTSSLDPSTLNAAVTFTAPVSPSAATGTVTFKDGTTTLGTTSVVAGIATYVTASLSSGAHSITAVYSGDANYNTSTSGTLTQTVNPPKPVITSSLTATGTINTAFSYQITATNSPTSYNATGLPGGLSINTTTGLISGTPSVSGPFNVTISATNSGGTGSATLALTINPAAPPPAPVITSSLSATGTQNTAFSYQITATNSPTSFGAGGLPAGLSVNSTGLISGTPTGSGTSNVTISATNSGGTGSATLVLTINSQGDTTPPTAPTNLTDPGMTSSQVTLAWTASTDNVGVKGYQVYRAKKNGKANKSSSFSLIGTSSITGYTDIGVTSGSTYQYYVKAYDAAGNVSAPSNTLQITAP